MLVGFNNLKNRGVAAQLAVLGLAVLTVLIVVGPLDACLSGTAALAAAILAAALCFTGAGVALVFSHWLRGPEHVLIAMFVGLIFRTGFPLMVGVLIFFRGGPLAEAGLLYYLLGFYPVTLVVETVLSLPKCCPSPSCQVSSNAVPGKCRTDV